MRRSLVPALVALLGFCLASLPDAPARSADAADEVRRVFTLAFDQSRSLEDRLRYIEDGGAIRTKVLDVQRARVRGVRLHGRRAEVDFDLVRPSGESLGRLVPFGVVVPDGGRWRVSRHTICALALIQGLSACPGDSPLEDWRTYWLGKRFHRHTLTDGMRVVVPLTFLDGTSAELVFPEGIDLRGSYVTAGAALAFRNPARSVRASYRARNAPVLARYRGVALDYEGNLSFTVGEWTVRVYAADLSERDRGFLARHLEFRATSNGLVALRSDAAASSATLSFSPDGAGGLHGHFELAHAGCATANDASDPSPGRRCASGTGIELSAEGTDAFVHRLLTETEIHDVRHSMPR